MKIIKSTDGDYVEIDLQQIAETDLAIKVSDGDNTGWLPKSQLEDDPELLDNGLIRVVIPEWIAIERGFV